MLSSLKQRGRRLLFAGAAVILLSGGVAAGEFYIEVAGAHITDGGPGDLISAPYFIGFDVTGQGVRARGELSSLYFPTWSHSLRLTAFWIDAVNGPASGTMRIVATDYPIGPPVIHERMAVDGWYYPIETGTFSDALFTGYFDGDTRGNNAIFDPGPMIDGGGSPLLDYERNWLWYGWGYDLELRIDYEFGATGDGLRLPNSFELLRTPEPAAWFGLALPLAWFLRKR